VRHQVLDPAVVGAGWVLAATAGYRLLRAARRRATR
jgi:hypothetical protein